MVFHRPIGPVGAVCLTVAATQANRLGLVGATAGTNRR